MKNESEPNPRKELEELGYDIVYKPHKEIADYNAFYRVEYKGEKITCPVAERWDIPMDEIWVSEKYEYYEKYILYHELNEIKYKADGFEGMDAHERALQEDKVWEGDPKWEEFRREINIVSEELVIKIPGFDEKMFERIMENRPYFDMQELKDVPYVEEKRFKKLKENFWCIIVDL